MKKLILNSTILLSLLAVIVSCDFVRNVNQPVAPTTTTGSTVVYRNVLVEDYTGHKCGNCPAAAVQLTTMEAQYPGKVIPLAIHAGFFAKTNVQYPTDFQTTVGDAYDTQFGNSAAGNPNGLINRVGYGTGSFIKQWSSWGAEVATQLAKPAIFQIRIHNVFNSATSILNTDVTVKSLANNTGTYKLVVLVTEDSLIAEQLDYRQPSGQQTIPNYEFNHVLRTAVNSTWGDAVFTSSANLNDSIVKTYSNFSINSAYRASKCHIVAYIYDASPASTTYYEVLEANEAKLK